MGNIHGALRAARNVGQATYRDRSLRGIPKVQSNTSDFDGALWTAQSIEGAQGRTVALSTIAQRILAAYQC